MKERDNSMNLTTKRTGKEENNNLRGYPLYSAGEDFYSKYQEDKDVDPENISLVEDSSENEENTTICVLDSENPASVDNLDVPGAELDDEQEEIGSEDEENNYYSIGGDDHLDLEEDKGE
jgi:hypothetical protein